MSEQERGEQLEQVIDRMMAGEALAGDDPLLETGRLLVLWSTSLEPGAAAKARFEQRLEQWFGPFATQPLRARLGPGPIVALIAALVALAISLLILARSKPTPAPSPLPSIAVTSAVTIGSSQATTAAPAAPGGLTGALLPLSCLNDSGQPAPDDSGDLAVVLTVSGRVQAISQTNLRLNNLEISLPTSVALPAGLQPGAIATVQANLCNDDSLMALTVTLGLATVIPTEISTNEPTVDNTQVVTPVVPVPTLLQATLPGCNKPQQPLAQLISTTFSVSYEEVVYWRCKGFTFGVTARAYLLILNAQQDGKSLTVEEVLTLRLKGKAWQQILVELGLQPNTESFIIIVNNGQVVATQQCKKQKKQKDCKPPKKPKK